ncbi:MAG: hypothetical protein PHP53_22220 [Prolixibacteraceae bacterium]|jgi:uncharacterized membrane protein|nr:hypothetical protein [Prolixibacteraceae bacterium]
MTIYKLPDGTEFNLSDQIHKEERSDGWYIIGNDQEVKVKDEARADRYIEIYNRDRYKYYIIH